MNKNQFYQFPAEDFKRMTIAIYQRKNYIFCCFHEKQKHISQTASNSTFSRTDTYLLRESVSRDGSRVQQWHSVHLQLTQSFPPALPFPTDCWCHAHFPV